MPNEISVEKAKELLDGAIAQAQELMKDPSKVLVLLEEFEKKTNDQEFDPILRNDQEGVEKDLTVEMKPK